MIQNVLMKTGRYYVIHIRVAAMVAYAVKGNLWASLARSLLEPTVQVVAFFFHEKAWDRIARRGAIHAITNASDAEASGGAVPASTTAALRTA
jgi:uncharacterized membrane protein